MIDQPIVLTRRVSGADVSVDVATKASLVGNPDGGSDAFLYVSRGGISTANGAETNTEAALNGALRSSVIPITGGDNSAYTITCKGVTGSTILQGYVLYYNSSGGYINSDTLGNLIQYYAGADFITSTNATSMRIVFSGTTSSNGGANYLLDADWFASNDVVLTAKDTNQVVRRFATRSSEGDTLEATIQNFANRYIPNNMSSFTNIESSDIGNKRSYLLDFESFRWIAGYGAPTSDNTSGMKLSYTLDGGRTWEIGGAESQYGHPLIFCFHPTPNNLNNTTLTACTNQYGIFQRWTFNQSGQITQLTIGRSSGDTLGKIIYMGFVNGTVYAISDLGDVLTNDGFATYWNEYTATIPAPTTSNPFVKLDYAEGSECWVAVRENGSFIVTESMHPFAAWSAISTFSNFSDFCIFKDMVAVLYGSTQTIRIMNGLPYDVSWYYSSDIQTPTLTNSSERWISLSYAKGNLYLVGSYGSTAVLRNCIRTARGTAPPSVGNWETIYRNDPEGESSKVLVKHVDEKIYKLNKYTTANSLNLQYSLNSQFVQSNI